MHAHVAEVIAETWSKVAACRIIKWLIRGPKGFVNDGWCNSVPHILTLDALKLCDAPLCWMLLLSRTLRTRSPERTSGLCPRLWHTRHLLSDAICLLLVFVPRPIACQIRLECIGLGRTYGNPSKIVSEMRSCRTAEHRAAFFSIALKKPQNCLIPYRAREVEERVRVMTLPNVGSTDRRSSAGLNRSSRFVLLQISAHNHLQSFASRPND